MTFVEILVLPDKSNRNSEDVVQEYYSQRNCRVEKTMKGFSKKLKTEYVCGTPDFLVREADEEKPFYVEAKIITISGACGSLTKTQIEWIIQHPEEKIKVVYVKKENGKSAEPLEKSQGSIRENDEERYKRVKEYFSSLSEPTNANVSG
jgi:uncharacterized protein YgbK (DUF1537 family)